MLRPLILSLFLILSFVSQTIAQDDPALTYAYTYHQPTGNRFVAGQGTFPQVTVVDYALENEDVPVMVTGTPFFRGETVFWQIVGVRNSVSGVETRIEDGSVSTFLPPSPLTEYSLPILATNQQDATFLIGINQSNASPLTHAVPYGSDMLYVSNAGEILLQRGGQNIATVQVNALPDARIVVNEAGQIAVYAQATNQRYVHGVVGDEFEAAALTVLEIEDDALHVVTKIDLPDNDVFEGLSPFWADIDGDGADDLVVTVSNAQVGAEIRAYRADGSLLATGPAIGRGGRWRHQLAFAPFGPNGEQELVDVLTPHIGGVVEFYQLSGDQLEIVATLPGYTSHVIGSRNLDMAVAGDFNGDGQPEIVLPTQDRRVIAGLQHTAEGVREVWRLPLDGVLSSNLSAVTLPDHTMALAAGTVDGRLRIWLPSE